MNRYLIDFGMAIFGLFLLGFVLRLIIQRLIWGLSGTQQGVLDGLQRLVLRYRLKGFLTGASEAELRRFALALVMAGYEGRESGLTDGTENADDRDMFTHIKEKAWDTIKSMERNQALNVISEFLDEHHPSLTRIVFGNFRIKGCQDEVVNY